MKAEQIGITWKNPWDGKRATGGLSNIYDALARGDADIYIVSGDKRLYFKDEEFTVIRCDEHPPIPLIHTTNEAAAVNVLTGHARTGD